MSKRLQNPTSIVWFKRDLRVEDHRPLTMAARRGPVIPLFVIEPGLWAEPDMSDRHWAFVSECLSGLQGELADLGQSLVIRTGDVTEILEKLQTNHAITDLWSHEETGNGWTYARDLRVAAWCRSQGIVWHEIPQHGVQRRLKSRNGWARHWNRFMGEPLVHAPHLQPLDVDPGILPSAQDLKIEPDPCPQRQTGGRRCGLALLHSFLMERGEPYRSAMSSPEAGAKACSRLSPYLSWGAVSMREVAQATWERQRDLKHASDGMSRWRGSMQSFSGRLHWHCHFMQKLEDEPLLEWQNLHRGYDGVRPSVPDQDRLYAWSHGETGLPFVDACMRSLRATGWLNFRMRAMVMAVVSYHLWLDWRAPGLELARLFTDYEAGIHWPQVQMQSGTTGINTVRIYNPIKQGHDQDPTGIFTRRWVPELADIPDAHLQEPWNAENAGRVLGRTYPHPIIDHLAAAKSARQQIWGVRKGEAFRSEAGSIQEKHGSRKSGIRHRGQRSNGKPTTQLDLSLDGDPS